MSLSKIRPKDVHKGPIRLPVQPKLLVFRPELIHITKISNVFSWIWKSYLSRICKYEHLCKHLTYQSSTWNTKRKANNCWYAQPDFMSLRCVFFCLINLPKWGYLKYNFLPMDIKRLYEPCELSSHSITEHAHQAHFSRTDITYFVVNMWGILNDTLVEVVKKEFAACMCW